jgi:hypothetical protein
LPIRDLFVIALGLTASCVAQASAVMAQARPDPATQRAAASNQAVMRPMVFYDAHGDANACGTGCSEWIAAEGKIEKGTADRLQELLAQLKGTRPPIFFQSPGGSVTGSMLLGELIRARKLTVSVGRTVPLNCDRGPANQNSCETEIRADHPMEAELDAAGAMCNSACVYALAGGFVRLIPPWITLGIHDVGFDPATTRIRHPSAMALEAAKAATDTHLRSYIRRMGIDDGLLTEAFATPFTSLGRLSRDDAARFGLDRREFGETAWQFADKPQPTIRKTFFARSSDSNRHYVNALVSVSCVPWLGAKVFAVFARERLSSDTEIVIGPPTISLRVTGQDIRLDRKTSAKIYLWSTPLQFKTFEAVSDDAVMVLSGTGLAYQNGSAGDITLAMTGFSAAYAKLQKTCAEQIEQAQTAQTAGGMPQFPAALQSPPGTSTPPPLRSNPLSIGASRYAVDATLGAPTELVGTTALYGYVSSSGEGKVMAGYFDRSGRLQRFARYVLKDGKVFDEISQSDLSEGKELLPVRHLLADPSSLIGSGRPIVLPDRSQ